jgi:hypothetical protein
METLTRTKCVGTQQDKPYCTTAKKSTTIPATIVSFNIVASIRGTVAVKR